MNEEEDDEVMRKNKRNGIIVVLLVTVLIIFTIAFYVFEVDTPPQKVPVNYSEFRCVEWERMFITEDISLACFNSTHLNISCTRYWNGSVTINFPTINRTETYQCTKWEDVK